MLMQLNIIYQTQNLDKTPRDKTLSSNGFASGKMNSSFGDMEGDSEPKVDSGFGAPEMPGNTGFFGFGGSTCITHTFNYRHTDTYTQCQDNTEIDCI